MLNTLGFLVNSLPKTILAQLLGMADSRKSPGLHDLVLIIKYSVDTDRS